MVNLDNIDPTAMFLVVILFVFVLFGLPALWFLKEREKKKETEPKCDHERFSFLSENEHVLRELERGWQVVRRSRKLSEKTKSFRFGELRKPLLTNKRLMLLKGPWGKKKEIDYEIPIDNIKSVEWKLASSDIAYWTPYLRIHLKNGEIVSVAFVYVGIEERPEHEKRSYIPEITIKIPKQKEIIDRWLLAINELIESRENSSPSTID